MSNPPQTLSPEAAEYLAALGAGQLLLRVCSECGEHHHYPRPHCPFCGGARTEWRTASGRGVVYAFTVIRRGPGAGLAPAFVTLEEGPTIPTTISGCELERIQIGQAVALMPPPETGGDAPVFTPIDL